MASVFDEYAQECMAEQAKEAVIRLLKAGASVELVSKAFPSLSIDDIKQLEQQELANA